jgi:hypothetical protein
MYTSSPGGIALQDYHWSGGFYSPKFLSYDKWGQSLPHDLYGFNSTVSEMVPPSTYNNNLQQFPISIRNYELLKTAYPYPIQTPTEPIIENVVKRDHPKKDYSRVEAPPKVTAIRHPQLSERFEDAESNKKSFIVTILFFLVFYIFEKTLDVYVKDIGLGMKMVILVALLSATYIILVKR